MTAANVDSLFEKFKDYVPGLEPDKLRDLIGAIAHEGWREETGRADTVKTQSRLLNEAAELVHAASALVGRLVEESAAYASAAHNVHEAVDADESVSPALLGSWCDVSKIGSQIVEHVFNLRGYQQQVERAIREFATSYNREKQTALNEAAEAVGRHLNSSPGIFDGGDVTLTGAGAGGSIADIKQRVIRFNFHGHGAHAAGLYRVVVRPFDLVVEHLAGFDGIGGECWQPVEGELRGVLLSELAFRKSFGFLDSRGTLVEKARKRAMPASMLFQTETLDPLYGNYIPDPIEG